MGPKTKLRATKKQFDLSQRIEDMETIDFTPTWSYLMPALIEILRNPESTEEAKNNVADELLDLAKKIDSNNVLNKNILLHQDYIKSLSE